MKVHKNLVFQRITNLEEDFSFLASEIIHVTDTKSIPNSDLEILSEKLRLMSNHMDEIFDLISQYEKD